MQLTGGASNQGMSTESSLQSKPTKGRFGKPGALRNVFSNWSAYAIAMGVNFFVSPFVVRHLGNAGYGVWTLLLSLTGYLGLLDLGVRGAVTRYVAKYHAEEDHRKASNVASSAMVIFASAGGLAILVSLVIATAVVGRMNIPGQYLGAARIVVVLIGLNVAISLVNGVFGGILVGLQRFDLTNGIEVGINLLRACAVVLALYSGYGIVTLALIQLMFTIARWVANIILARQLYPELRIALAAADQAGLKLIFSFSIFSFLLHVSGSLIYATDNVVIGAYLPVTAVTFYAIAGNLLEYTRTLVSGISQTMTPLASSIEARSDENRLKNLALFSSRAGTMVVLPIAVTLLLRGSSFIVLWMGPQFGELSGHVLWILSLALPFWAGNSVVAGSLLGLGKHKPLVPGVLAEGLCNLALSILWVKKIGILGVAWGTLVPSLAMNLFFWPWYIRRALGIAPLPYVYSSWIRPLVGIMPFVFATFAIERFFPATHLIAFFSQTLIVLPLAFLGFWATCLDREHREGITRIFTRSVERVLVRS
jgi:O-antigen/teichoic acid export membrane protein